MNEDRKHKAEAKMVTRKENTAMPSDNREKPDAGQNNDYEAMARKIIAERDDVWKSAVKRAEKRLADFEKRQMELEKAKLEPTQNATIDQQTKGQGLPFKPEPDQR